MKQQGVNHLSVVFQKMIKSNLLKVIFQGSHAVSESMFQIDSENRMDLKDLNSPELKEAVIRHMVQCYLNLRGRYKTMLPDVQKRMPGVDLHQEVEKMAKERAQALNLQTDKDQSDPAAAEGSKLTKRKPGGGRLKRNVGTELQKDPPVHKLTAQ
jgi:hypothetical protein